MTTIREVSKRAGVSVSTVSRVVNGTKYVSPDIEQRVRNAIEQLNYQPSAFARGLRVQKSQSVGVFIPALNDVFFCNFAYAVETSLYEAGYHPLFCNIANSIKKESTYIDILISQQVDAAIIVPSIPSKKSVENIKKFVDRNIPVVIVERPLLDIVVSEVMVDNFEGGYLGAAYLLESGHQHIGVIASTDNWDVEVCGPGPGHHRIAGIQAAFQDSGLRDSVQLEIENCDSAIELGYDGTKRLLNRFPETTAIFALTDQIAVGVYQGIHELGLSIPDDLSVLGFDNIPIASHIVPQLTTVSQPIQQMGEHATKLLLEHIQNPNMQPKTVTLNTELIERASVKKRKP